MASRSWSAFLALHSLICAAADADVGPLRAAPVELESAEAPEAAASCPLHPPEPGKNLIQVRSMMPEAHTFPLSSDELRPAPVTNKAKHSAKLVGKKKAAGKTETWPYLEGCEVRLVGNTSKREIPDSAITASSSNNKDASAVGPPVSWGPERSRMDCNISCWLAADTDDNQWISWDFGKATEIRRVWTRGRKNPGQAGDSNWVKSYTLEYKNTKKSDEWIEISGNFEANKDRDSVKENILSPFVVATHLKLRPTAWQDRIALRAEIIGCDVKTTTTTTTMTTKALDTFEMPLVGDVLPDSWITSSSQRSSSYAPTDSRFYSSQCWAPKQKASSSWLQWEFNAARVITRLQTKGCGKKGLKNGMEAGVGKYYIIYKDCRDSDEWKAIERKFNGSKKGSMKEHYFSPPLIATHLRLWYVGPEDTGLRVEIIGHAMPMPIAPPVTVSAVCNDCLCEGNDDSDADMARMCRACAFGINSAYPCNVTGICRCAPWPQPIVIPPRRRYVPVAPPEKKEKSVSVPYPMPIVVDPDNKTTWTVPEVPMEPPKNIPKSLRKYYKPLSEAKATPNIDVVPVSPGSMVPVGDGYTKSGCKAVPGGIVVDDDCTICGLEEPSMSWPCNDPTCCSCSR